MTDAIPTIVERVEDVISHWISRNWWDIKDGTYLPEMAELTRDLQSALRTPWPPRTFNGNPLPAPVTEAQRAELLEIAERQFATAGEPPEGGTVPGAPK